MISPVSAATPQIDHLIESDTRVSVAKVRCAAVFGIVFFWHWTFVPFEVERVEYMYVYGAFVL